MNRSSDSCDGLFTRSTSRLFDSGVNDSLRFETFSGKKTSQVSDLLLCRELVLMPFLSDNTAPSPVFETSLDRWWWYRLHRRAHCGELGEYQTSISQDLQHSRVLDRGKVRLCLDETVRREGEKCSTFSSGHVSHSAGILEHRPDQNNLSYGAPITQQARSRSTFTLIDGEKDPLQIFEFRYRSRRELLTCPTISSCTNSAVTL